MSGSEPIPISGNPIDRTRKFEWEPTGKVLTGTFQALERVSLTTTNLVGIENGVFVLKPLVTKITVEDPYGTEHTSLYLDDNWANYIKTKQGQDDRINKKIDMWVDQLKMTPLPPRTMFGGVNDSNVLPEVQPIDDNDNADKQFGGGISNLDLSSSIRKSENIGLKYHKGKTEKCVEQCIRRNSSSRRTRRRPKAKQRK